jgi:MarR family transcriptional regulator, organic hydroperoxide resistance regulator
MTFEKSLNYLLADLTTVHKNLLEKTLSEYGVHSGQIFILFELWTSDGLSQTVLAANLNLTPPTINKMVKSLETKDFVSLKRSDSDTRIVNVYLTEKGKNIHDEIARVWSVLEDKITKNLTETEKLIFHQLIEKVLLNFYT